MHNIRYMAFSLNATEAQIGKARAEIVNRESDNERAVGFYGHYKLHDVICDSYDEAVERIREYDNGWYDDHGVKYRDYAKVKPTKQMDAVEKRIADVRRRRREYAELHMPSRVKAKYIGCTNCGSKIAKEYLKGVLCPICRKDLRSKTTIEKLKGYDEKIAQLETTYYDLEKKQKNKAEVKWLIKLEFHS